MKKHGECSSQHDETCLSGASAEEVSSRVKLSPSLTLPTMQTRDFRAITIDPSHVLRQLLPKPKHTGYVLRPQAHGYELPVKDEHNFISRMLYKNIYCSK